MKQKFNLEITTLQNKIDDYAKENSELKLLVAAIEQNKQQMKEIYNEKEKENQILLEKIRKLQAEINETQVCETTRDLLLNSSLLRTGSLGTYTHDCDNYEMFLKLLSVSQGILFKNRYIQVGISIKVKDFTAVAILYIGNCRNRPITSLETEIESEDLKIMINTQVESAPIPQGQQADRVIQFQYTKFFMSPPKLIIKYGDSKKVLKLPITPALFLRPGESERIKETWENLPEMYMKDIGKCLVKLEEVVESLCLYPNFQFVVVENKYFLYCKEVIVMIQSDNGRVRLEGRGVNEELLCLICNFMAEKLVDT